VVFERWEARTPASRITYPDGTSISFGYDSRGRRTSVTDQNNKTTTYAYDDADRMISVTDPANTTTYYAYDTEDNLTSITDANITPPALPTMRVAGSRRQLSRPHCLKPTGTTPSAI